MCPPLRKTVPFKQMPHLFPLTPVQLSDYRTQTGATWGGPWDDFPENGWDKLMALNVKSIFYMTVGLQDLLLKGTNADMPSRVINIASMAGIMTSDVTSGDDGGLAAPGHGTFSCKSL